LERVEMVRKSFDLSTTLCDFFQCTYTNEI